MRRLRSGDLFPTDHPIPASQMIGRNADVRRVATAAMAGTNLVVAGPRRTGKTSVCEAALNLARSKRMYTVAVDLFRIPTAAQLAEALVAETIANRSAVKRLLHRSRRAGRAVLDIAEQAVEVKMKSELGEDVEIAFRPELAARDPDRYLTYALELPNRIAKLDGKHVIVFFDEFQEIVNPRRPYGDPDALTKRMRSIFQRSDEVSYLFAGSVESVMRDLFAPESKAFGQFGSFSTLAPIDQDSWRSGLTERFAADGCEIDPSALERLIELGELHPRATMLIAQKSHLASIMLATKKIDLSLVAQGFELAREGDAAANEQAVERIRRAHKVGLVVARRVALGDEPYRGLDDSEAHRALTALRNAGVIEQRRPRRWSIANPILRRYLADLEPVAAR
ncbi:MAG: hypothetical protein ACRDQ2_00025 [Gaiellales bacterium]